MVNFMQKHGYFQLPQVVETDLPDELVKVGNRLDFAPNKGISGGFVNTLNERFVTENDFLLFGICEGWVETGNLRNEIMRAGELLLGFIGLDEFVFFLL